MFIFSCYTGLAYVDVLQLKKSELELDKNNTYWIRFKRQKTGSKSHVPLLAIPNAILHKYSNVEDLLADETIFNLISNQKINAYLKEIADVCKIEKCLTFHMARHTFATRRRVGIMNLPSQTYILLVSYARFANWVTS